MPKSPVFGLGRNWKHRPTRKARFAPSAANVNMRGKPYRRMGCGCCSCIDFRHEVLAKQHRKQIKNWDQDQ